MIGGLRAGGRVAAATLLALGSVAPLNGTVLVATPVAPAAETSTACAVTVGTATTDPALATDAARAIAVGYTVTDCLPDAALLAAAEARAAIPMDTSTTTPTTQTSVSTPLGGSSSSGSVALAPATTTTPAAAPTTTETPTPAPTSETTSETTSSGTTTTSETDVDSDNGSSSGTEGSEGSEGSEDEASGNNPGSNNPGSNNPGSNNPGSLPPTGNADCADASGSGTANVLAADGTATTDGTATDSTVADVSTATAACKLGWGTAVGIEDFDDPGLTKWSRYDGPGHGGNGIRSPEAMSVKDGILTITGDSNGTTGGMAWQDGRSKYGRWEARVKSPVADPSYNAVMLLWPSEVAWPAGGEVDFMEIGDETRQKVDFFLHYSAQNRQLHDQVEINATQWHNWAVEWSPTQITGYVDGNPWFTTTQASALPPGPMHLTLQLDWFPKGGSVQQSAMHVDWVRYYPIDGAGDSGQIVNSLDNTSDTGVTLNRSSLIGTTGGTDAGTGGTDAGTGGGTDSTDGGTNGTTDNGMDDDTSVAGATSTTTVTVTPEDDATPTVTDDPQPATSGDNSADAVDTSDPAPVVVEVEENVGDATPTADPAD